MVHRRDDGAGSPAHVRRREKGNPDEPPDHALDRSHGGLTCKIHILCDGEGRPLHLHLTAGQTHEAAAFDAVMIGADEHLFDLQGAPIVWPAVLAGGKGYRANWIDEYLLDLEITLVIPSKCNEDHDARPVAFDKETYRNRNVVERLIGWLKGCRRVFSRFEKTAKNFAGMIKLAFIQRYPCLATT